MGRQGLQNKTVHENRNNDTSEETALPSQAWRP